MKIKSTRFGVLEIDETKVINFPKGIPGFEQLRSFFILPVEGTEDIHWLHAVEDPAVALLVIDPFKFFQGYSFEIPDSDIEELSLQVPSEALVLAVITVPEDNPGGATANLVAPIVINTRLNRGKQVILTGSPYTTKHRLFPDAGGSSTTKGEEGKVVAGEGK